MHHARHEDDTDRQTLLSLIGKSANEVKAIFDGDDQPLEKQERRHIAEPVPESLNRHERRKAAKLSRSPRVAGASPNTPAKP